MRRWLLAAVAVAALAGCATPQQRHEQLMLDRGCHVGEPDEQCNERIAAENQARWRVANCDTTEDDQQCLARINREQREITAARRAFEATPEYRAMEMIEAQRLAAQQAWQAEMEYRRQAALCTAAGNAVMFSIDNFWAALAAGLATTAVCMP